MHANDSYLVLLASTIELLTFCYIPPKFCPFKVFRVTLKISWNKTGGYKTSPVFHHFCKVQRLWRRRKTR